MDTFGLNKKATGPYPNMPSAAVSLKGIQKVGHLCSRQ